MTGPDISFYGKYHPEFPTRLREIPGAPGGLYVNGSLPRPDRPSVAIVGARMCSAYGKRQAFAFASELARCGVQIISGLAYGIDVYAHKGALAAGGLTYAVMGCGADVCYPKRNQEVYREIVESGGGILSEFPNQSEPSAWHFPIRNRIISGLADLVLVVEAKQRSGSLITADYALEQGRSVFALPGRVDEPLSEGCNYLIYQGAGIAYSVQAVRDELDAVFMRCRQGKGTDGPARVAKRMDGSAANHSDTDAVRKRTYPVGSVPAAGEADAAEAARTNGDRARDDLTRNRRNNNMEETDGSDLTPEERLVVRTLGTDLTSIGQLARMTGLPMPRLALSLTALLAKGRIEEDVRNYYRRM